MFSGFPFEEIAGTFAAYFPTSLYLREESAGEKRLSASKVCYLLPNSFPLHG